MSSFTPEQKAFIREVEALAATQWGSFTDNFIWMHCTGEFDWFDEGQWQIIIHNTRILAKAALLGRCAGICFDADGNRRMFEAMAEWFDKHLAAGK